MEDLDDSDDSNVKLKRLKFINAAFFIYIQSTSLDWLLTCYVAKSPIFY